MTAATNAKSAMGLVWSLGAATTLVVLAFAMSTPVLAIQLQKAGYSATAVGAFAMINFLVVGALIPVVPRVIAAWGVVRTYRRGCGLQLLGAIGFALGDGLVAWSAAAVVSGIGTAALWNATEALLAREAAPDQRGRVMGLYQTSMGAALAVGPILPAVLGWGARPILWLAVVMMLACGAIAVAVRRSSTSEPPPQAHSGTWHAIRTVPALAVLAFTGGVFEAGLNAISAAHASAIGLGLSAAASVAGAIGVGSFLCQYPAGVAADRCSPFAVFGTGGALLLAASIAVGWADSTPWLLWAAGSVWGGVGGALYTLSMVYVAHAFAGRATAGGAAAMISCYTAGAAVGPVVSGFALDRAGMVGLSVWLCAMALVPLAAARKV